MAYHTPIEWTGATWNPVTGCTLVDEGCRNCYAATLAATRLKHHPSRAGLARMNAAGEAKFTGEVRFNQQWLEQPLRWKRPRMIFVCAHGDLFHPGVTDDQIDSVYAVMALTPQHTYQVLTKRPERAVQYLARRDERGRHPAMTCAALLAATGSWNTPALDLRDWPLPNVWLGTSVSDQESARGRIPSLLAADAVLHFLSAEPLLGALDLTQITYDPVARIWSNALTGRGFGKKRLKWVIVGGESGRHARPMHPSWPRHLRDQCEAAGTHFFFKQWGGFAPGADYPLADLGGVKVRAIEDATPKGRWLNERGGPGVHLPAAIRMVPATKKAAGRLLDGVEWSQMPEVSHV